MSAPSGAPPQCERCNGHGFVRTADADGVRDVPCGDCEGTGTPALYWWQLIIWLQSQLETRKDLPEVVVLCGSTRFKDAFYTEGRRLSFEGKIVLTVSDLDPNPANRERNVPIPATLKARLDALHLRKIDLADRVHVLNVGGYIGESTRAEIEYATTWAKPITYLEP